MDEATESVDYATDTILQKVIMDLSCTVITIAHRLDTVKDYDRVVVLARGEIVEVGTVDQLQERKDGAFKRLLREQKETKRSKSEDSDL